MELEKRSTPIGKTLGLGRLALLLIISILGIAGFWHVTYDVSVGKAIAVVGEIAALLTVAFLCAWRWSR